MKLEEGYAWIREGAGIMNGFAAGVVTNMTVKGLVSNLVEDSIDNPIVSMGVKAISATSSALVGGIVHKATGEMLDNSLHATAKCLTTAQLFLSKEKMTNEEAFSKLTEIWTGIKAE